MIKHVADLPVAKVLDAELPSYFVVPKYQREYVWGTTDWDALFEDFVENESNDGHFLGTFLAVNQEQASHNAPRYEVIDGQQRLTTLSLLLAAIYSFIVRDTEADDDKVFERMSLRKMLVLDEHPRLTPQESGSNREDYFAVLQIAGLKLSSRAKAPKWMGLRRIERAYRHFIKLIQAHATAAKQDDLWAARDMLDRVKRAILVKLEVATFSDAFKLFESLNNRGKPLTPIDLIKNTLLARAEHTDGLTLDSAYEDWKMWLERLGDDYATQERFFRQYYNAMKDVWGMSLVGAPLATRSNLIKIYEEQVGRNLTAPPAAAPVGTPSLLDGLNRATAEYERIITLTDASQASPLEKAFTDLVRAEGTTAHVLLLYLLLTQTHRELTDDDILSITRLLTSFSVRRNMTNQPPTYELQRLFMEVIADLEQTDAKGAGVRELILAKLARRSASDEQFAQALGGSIYQDHTNVARFVLTRLAQNGMTRETWQNLWVRDQNRSGAAAYRWTIEHILPQTPTLGSEWIDMLGGSAAAAATQEAHVHELGNLTITGFNSSLGKKSFIEKRDRTDDAGNHIGYRNGLNLNADLVVRNDWTEEAIVARTVMLIADIVAEFPLR